jgi:hypothetical protein
MIQRYDQAIVKTWEVPVRFKKESIMSFGKKLSAIWSSVFKPAPAPAPEPTSYGVIVSGAAYAENGAINPLFVAQATPVAEKVVDILKQNGLKDDAVEVTIGALSTVEPHQGVRFEANFAVAQSIANALPNHVVIRSDCRVVCPQSRPDKKPRCEID